jgi:3-oxoadipate enol-lactonase
MRRGEVTGPRGSLHYAVSGRLHAPSVVLLHPLGADLQVWDGVLPELERFFAVLRVDLAGHGGSRSTLGALASDPRMADLGMADLAAEVLAVCDELSIERAHFCGISLGGAIALEIALTAPQRVHRLVLANTAPHFPSRELWDERIELVRERGMAPVVEAMPERWFTPEYRESHVEQIKLLAERMGRTEPLAYTQACAALKIFDRRDDLPRLSVPTWVLAGTRDVVTPVEDAERWSQQIPGADLWVIDAGHLAVIEQSSDFVTALLAFWRD